MYCVLGVHFTTRLKEVYTIQVARRVFARFYSMWKYTMFLLQY